MEEWKDIKGYEGRYKVSDKGRVMSLCGDKPVIKSQHGCGPDYKMKNSYKKVSLYGGNKKNHKVHRLVAEAFIPNPHNKRCVNHLNGKKYDNRVENLQWVTFAENNKHAVITGLNKNTKGEKKVDAKLNRKQVIHIKRSKGKVLIKELADKYDVSKSLISRIQNDKRWTHVKV